MQLVKEFRELDKRFTKHKFIVTKFISSLHGTHIAKRHCLFHRVLI
jgi:hypothetical protein